VNVKSVDVVFRVTNAGCRCVQPASVDSATSSGTDGSSGRRPRRESERSGGSHGKKSSTTSDTGSSGTALAQSTIKSIADVENLESCGIGTSEHRSESYSEQAEVTETAAATDSELHT